MERNFRVVSVTASGYRFVVALSTTKAAAYRMAWCLQLAARQRTLLTRYLVEEV